MADQETPGTGDTTTTDQGEGAEAPATKKAPARKTAAKKTTAKKAAAKKAPAKKAAAKKSATEDVAAPAEETAPAAPAGAEGEPAATEAPPARKTAARKSTAKKAASKKAAAAPEADAGAEAPASTAGEPTASDGGGTSAPASAAVPLFQPPEQAKPARKRAAKKTAASGDDAVDTPAAEPAPASADETVGDGEGPTGARSSRARGGRAGAAKAADEGSAPAGSDEQASQGAGSADTSEGDAQDTSEDEGSGEGSGEGGGRRRRRRGGRRRRKSGGDGESSGGASEDPGASTGGEQDSGDDQEDDGQESGSSRRRRRRRREGDSSGGSGDDPENTVTRVRKGRSAEDEITAVTGSTRLEAKKQRRREGREAGRRRAPIVSEAEFLARRESVDRVMVIRQRDDLTQIGVLEDKVLVEHYVARESQTSLIGNVYLGRVQNVLPSMEAAFIDIGKGRNAVLYAGEVNWSALGHKDGAPRKIESVLTSGQTVLVQVTKDPVGHKGARLTSQISLAGRFLVYVPDGTTSGISRKLPDTERSRLKALLKEIVPDTAGVIVRTAAEGASEEELTRDVERLKARWEDIESKAKGSAPKLLYGEPDLTLKVVRDLFTEDFSKLVIEGDDAWETVHGYVTHVAPDLADRLEQHQRSDGGPDVFAAHRIDEQIAKALDRKVWLPSGGSLIIDRTEAMTVVDVNTGKFTGSGGNLEETVTKNNLEAAEEVVRQLRLRDIGGIIVVDFIDMVLESNRDLVLRRLVECLGRDRTKHQVAEVTSLGLVQMTRKRIGTGLLEAFSETCEHCQGRGLKVHDMPIEPKRGDDDSRRGRRRGGRGRSGGGSEDQGSTPKPTPTPKDVAAMARADRAEETAPENAPTPDDDAPGTDAAAGTGPAGGKPAAGDDAGATGETTQPARSRRRGSGTQAATPAAEEQPAAEDAPAPEEKPTPEEQPAQEQPAQEQPVAEEERVAGEEPASPAPTTATTRKRSARRPAGPPTATPAAAEPLVVAPTPAPADAAAAETGPAPAAEKPTVVTRTRRRAASRPAGPPGDAAGDAPADPADGSGETPSGVEHVPVKKKGARKR